MTPLGRARSRPKIVFTGGGTAGHILPMLAVAQALIAAGHQPSEIHFVGSRRGLEATLIEEAGIGHTLLGGRGIVRRFSLANLAAIAGLAAAFARALMLVVRLRPKVVVSVGGYASLACSLAAIVFRVPIVVINVDAVPGASIRLIARRARACAVSYPGTGLPHATVTGAPLRAAVLAVSHSAEGRDAARAALDLSPRARVVAVAGGSLGAWRLNQAGLGLAQGLAALEDVVVYHVTGARDHERVQQMAESLGLFAEPESGAAPRYRLVAYEARLPQLFAAADLVLSRAGAMSVAELAAIGTPSVLVPLPNAPGDHQTKNAEVLQRAGAALVVCDQEAQPDQLLELVKRLLDDPARLAEMGKMAASVARLDSSERVGALIDAVIAKKDREGERRR